jgi:hypothetical protein
MCGNSKRSERWWTIPSLKKVLVPRRYPVVHIAFEDRKRISSGLEAGEMGSCAGR